MTDKALHNKKEEKYFFTANIFDEAEVEEELPAAPVFSEQELETARRTSLLEGKQAALQEMENSISKRIGLILEKISQDMAILFNAEKSREETYEKETINLCLQVFAKVFPLYNEKYGFEELKNALMTILKKQEGQKSIAIAVAPEFVDGINEYLSKLYSLETGVKFTVKGDPSLSSGACKLAWEDGGAVRNPEAMADEIKSMMEQMLAGAATKGHDSKRPAAKDKAGTMEKPDEQ